MNRLHRISLTAQRIVGPDFAGWDEWIEAMAEHPRAGVAAQVGTRYKICRHRGCHPESARGPFSFARHLNLAHGMPTAQAERLAIESLAAYAKAVLRLKVHGRREVLRRWVRS